MHDVDGRGELVGPLDGGALGSRCPARVTSVRLTSIRPVAVGVALLAAALSGCVSTLPAQPHGACELDSRLAGVWSTGWITSQLGPARFTLSLSCDCRFRQGGLVLLMPIRVTGRYTAADGVLNLEGCCASRYHFEGEILVIQEESGDTFRYSRRKTYRCGAT
jgi:hypothetical protein